MIIDSLGDLLVLFYLMIPAVSLIWFITSLIFFLLRRKGTPARKFWRIHMIVSGIITGVTLGSIILYIVLFLVSIHLSGM